MSIEANDKARLVKCVPSQLYCSYAVFSRNREIRLAIFRLTSTDRHGYQYTWSSLNFEVPTSSAQRLFMSVPAPWPLILGFGSIAIYCFCLVLFRTLRPPVQGVTPRATVSLPSPTTLSPSVHSRSRPSSPTWVKIHYIAICIYSFICFMAVLYESGPGASVQHYMCAPLPPWLRALSWTFTVSKIWEWLDTADHFLRGESLSKIGFLHLYHHATTFFLFLNVMNYPSTERSGMLMNGFVHFLMYAHYAFRLPKWFRPIITAAQLAQLVTVTYLWHITPSTCGAPFDSFPADHPIEHLTPYTLVPVYTLFFLNFFVRQYIVPLVAPCFGVAQRSSDGDASKKRV